MLYAILRHCSIYFYSQCILPIVDDNFRVSKYRVYVVLRIILYYYANIKLNASGYKNISVSTTPVQKWQDTFIQYYGIPSNMVYIVQEFQVHRRQIPPLSEYPGIP